MQSATEKNFENRIIYSEDMAKSLVNCLTHGIDVNGKLVGNASARGHIRARTDERTIRKYNASGPNF